MRVFVPESHQADYMAYIAKAYPSDVADAGAAFSSISYERSTLTLREFEAARAMTAEINGCLWCQSWRSATDVPAYLESVGKGGVKSIANRGPAPDEAFYASVKNWKTSPIFSERERIAIEYAEGMGMRPKEIAEDENFWARAKASYSDAEIIDLTYCLACWIGMGRATHVLGLDQACARQPESEIAA